MGVDVGVGVGVDVGVYVGVLVYVGVSPFLSLFLIFSFSLSELENDMKWRLDPDASMEGILSYEHTHTHTHTHAHTYTHIHIYMHSLTPALFSLFFFSFFLLFSPP